MLSSGRRPVIHIDATAAEGNFYKTPLWLAVLPACSPAPLRHAGELLYPEYTEYDLRKEVTRYYNLFCNCGLTEEMHRNLMHDAIKQEKTGRPHILHEVSRVFLYMPERESMMY